MVTDNNMVYILGIHWWKIVFQLTLQIFLEYYKLQV